MSDGLYCMLAKYVKVMAPDISFDVPVHLTCTKNNNSHVQENGIISQRQAAYSASDYNALRTDVLLKYCKHHSKCHHNTSECNIISG